MAEAHQSVTLGVFLFQKDHLQKGGGGKSIKKYFLKKRSVNEGLPRCGQLTQLCFLGMHGGSGWPQCLPISGQCGKKDLEDHESLHVSSSASDISFVLAGQELPPCHSLPLGLQCSWAILLCWETTGTPAARLPGQLRAFKSFVPCQLVQ